MVVSESELRKEIKAIVAKGDLESLTSRVVREKLQEILGVDLNSRKKEIDSLLMAEIDNHNNSHSDEESEEEVSSGMKKTESDSDAEVDGSEEEDDYAPKSKKPKSKGAKKRKSNGKDDSDDDWNTKKAKKAKSAPAATNGTKKKSSAFTRSFKLTDELADVVGADVMKRHEVVKKVWAVIKERKLQDPSNKQFAVCDAQLKKVFGVDRFRTFGMMKYLKDHFLEEAE